LLPDLAGASLNKCHPQPINSIVTDLIRQKHGTFVCKATRFIEDFGWENKDVLRRLKGSLMAARYNEGDINILLTINYPPRCVCGEGRFGLRKPI
jgi:hypothetical protein